MSQTLERLREEPDEVAQAQSSFDLLRREAKLIREEISSASEDVLVHHQTEFNDFISKCTSEIRLSAPEFLSYFRTTPEGASTADVRERLLLYADETITQLDHIHGELGRKRA